MANEPAVKEEGTRTEEQKYRALGDLQLQAHQRFRQLLQSLYGVISPTEAKERAGPIHRELMNAGIVEAKAAYLELLKSYFGDNPRDYVEIKKIEMENFRLIRYEVKERYSHTPIMRTIASYGIMLGKIEMMYDVSEEIHADVVLGQAEAIKAQSEAVGKQVKFDLDIDKRARPRLEEAGKALIQYFESKDKKKDQKKSS